MIKPKLDGLTLLREVTQEHGIHLSVLVAETSLWANPEVHFRLVNENGSGAFFPWMRRYKKGQGEKRRQQIGNIILDDNTYANYAIKRSLGFSRGELVGFDSCHIWPMTCYDERYHTAIANLVLLPSPLAGLTDHDPEIQAALQFRSFELYKWHPESEDPPKKPEYYPSCWREPFEFTSKVEKAILNRKKKTI